jgi:hypothetical protein
VRVGLGGVRPALEQRRPKWAVPSRQYRAGSRPVPSRPEVDGWYPGQAAVPLTFAVLLLSRRGTLWGDLDWACCSRDAAESRGETGPASTAGRCSADRDQNRTQEISQRRSLIVKTSGRS